MENIKQSETKKKQLPALDPNKTRLGGSGGLSIISGTAGKIAKGAFNLIKSVLKGTSKKAPVKNITYNNPRISMTQAERNAAGY